MFLGSEAVCHEVRPEGNARLKRWQLSGTAVIGNTDVFGYQGNEFVIDSGISSIEAPRQAVDFLHLVREIQKQLIRKNCAETTELRYLTKITSKSFCLDACYVAKFCHFSEFGRLERKRWLLLLRLQRHPKTGAFEDQNWPANVHA